MAPPQPDARGPDMAKGVIPEGIWRLNVGRSRKLNPAEHVLWIVRDDGRELAFVSIEVDAAREVKLSSWKGEYGGGPVEVTGTGMKAQVESSRRGEIVTSGSMPGVGDFVERGEVLEGGRRLLCTGEVSTPDGVLTYVEDFDWISPSPLPEQDATVAEEA
jgi:hypothetical protein